jgi:AraC-like DNA-binding protein
MTKYREILRLKSLGISEREIATSCGVSRNNVARVCKRATELNIQWPLEPCVTDKDLQKQLFPKEETAGSGKRLLDCEYIRKELLKNGVTKKLLWTEYLEKCRQAGEEPLMYSQ